MPQKVSVIGGGVIGLSAAWRLAQKGFTVTLYHADPIGTGASGNAAGALKPFDALQTGWKQNLQQESLWMYPEFLKEVKANSGIDVPLSRCGRIAVYDRDQSLDKARRAAEKANENWPFTPAQSILDAATLRTYLPEVEQAARGAVLCHATATFNPQTLLKALSVCCQNEGVIFKHETLEELPAGKVVVAAGAFSQKFVPEAKVRPIKRQAILLEWPEATPLERITENGQVYLVPWQGGTAVYVGSTFEPEAGFDAAPTPEAECQLRKEAARLYPSLLKANLLERFSGLQSRCGGEGSSLFLGAVEGRDDVFVATGHGGVGFCMAPITAQKLCELLSA